MPEIEIVDRTTVRELGDRVEVEWALSARPDLGWAEDFQLAERADRHGPDEWSDGGGPDVFGAAVRWFVPLAELDAADDEVRRRLAVANVRAVANFRAGDDGPGA